MPDNNQLVIAQTIVILTTTITILPTKGNYYYSFIAFYSPPFSITIALTNQSSR